MPVMVARQNAAEVCPEGKLNRSDGTTSDAEAGHNLLRSPTLQAVLEYQIDRSLYDAKASARAAAYAEATGDASNQAVKGKATGR